MDKQSFELELTAAWRALSGTKTQEGWSVVSLSSESGIRCKAGRYFPDDTEAILIGFDCQIENSYANWPETTGFSTVCLPSSNSSSISWIGLKRKPAGDVKMFFTMIVDIMATISKNISAPNNMLLVTLLNRIRAWQHFMESSTQRGLSPAEVIGLCGELDFLIDLINEGVSGQTAVTAWRGPLGALHDFSFVGDGAVEVKSCCSDESFTVRISSAQQLDTNIVSPLYLVAFRYVYNEQGLYLRDRINSIRQLLSSDNVTLMSFDNRLLGLGVTSETSITHDDRFIQKEKRIYCVDDGFPRLSSSQLPVAIQNVKYSLDLSMINHSVSNINILIKTVRAD